LLDERVRLDLLVDELDALLEASGIFDDRGLRNAERGVLDRRFDEQRELEPARRAKVRAPAKHGELRRRHAMEREQLFAERLVAREHETARVAARVGLPKQLEKSDDVLVVRDDAVEFLEQIED